MIPTEFQYERATSLEDAIAKLQAANGAGKLIAGGHSLVPLMKLRLSEPTVLIDIARVPGLAGVSQVGDAIEIGAMTTHHDVATSEVLRDCCPVVEETAAAIGDPQVRNRGTLGGSLAHADPAADYPAVILALDASIHLTGPQGTRAVGATDFFQGVFTVDVAADEILSKVTFNPVRGSAYAKLHQRASRFAIVGVAATLDVDGGVIKEARVALTGAASCPSRLTNVEAALKGQPTSAEVIASAASGAAESVEDINGDIHASAEYRRAMIPVFVKRALELAVERAA